MKYLLITCCFAWAAKLSFAQPAAVAPEGYSIDVKITPYQKQWVYLAYYYGNIKGLADSAYLDGNSKGVFNGNKPLPQGIYIVASPTKTILFEMLISNDQHFSVATDTSSLDASLQFTGSADNEQFRQYIRFIGPIAEKAEALRLQKEAEKNATVQVKLQQQIDDQAKSINDYRLSMIAAAPESMLAVLFKSMQEVPLPKNLQQPKTKADTLAQYHYGKAHYWDNFDFMDGRLVRTPIFENKLKTYLNQWIIPDADSIIAEMNWMLALGRNDPEMFRYLIGYFVDNYMYPQIMGQDKVFLTVYERYIAGDKPKVDWLNERQKKVITERAYMLMANQLGGQANEMALVDTNNVVRKLHAIKESFTIVVFWDPHCGKCKEEIPRIDSLFKTAWKKLSVQVYAVMVNEDAAADWAPFIRKNGKGWVHVHQTKVMREAEEKANIPNFRQLYDMRSTPTLFLLDKDKRIIAKNVTVTDVNRLILQKVKG